MICSCFNQPKKFIFLILFFASNFIFAQDNFSGVIKDSISGQSISGISIRDKNSFEVKVSDSNGEFNFRRNSDEAISISIKHISYSEKEIVLTAGNKQTIYLSPRSYLAEEVNITATRVNNRSVGAYSDFSKAEIEKQNFGKDIPQLLSLTPSLVATSDAGMGVGYTGLRIRGSDATRINVTINGIPLNDAESHQAYWVDIPDLASSVENIQIQRGIGSSGVGGGAFGGGINILTGTLAPVAYGKISSSAGSFNTFKNSLSFGTGLISERFAFEGRLSKISSDGYIDRSESDLRSFFLSGGYYGKKNSLRAIVFSGTEKTQQAWYGITSDLLETNRTYNPAGEYSDNNGAVHHYNNQTDNYQQDNYQLIYSHEFKNNLTANLGFHYTRGKGYYEEYKQDESPSDYLLPTVIIGADTMDKINLVRQKWLSNDFYGITYSLNYSADKFDIKIGGAANKYDGLHYGKVIASEILPMSDYPHQYYLDNAVKSDVSVFAKITYSINASLNVVIDLQERLIDYSFYGFNENLINAQQNVNLSFFNPKAGINYLFNDRLSLYMSVAESHKEPVRDDYVASSPLQRPQPELMIDYEGGLRFNSSSLTAGVNGYYMDYENQLILTGKINDVGQYNRENVKNSYRIGVEMEGAVKFGKFNAGANLTLSNNKIKSYEEYIYNYDSADHELNKYHNTSISFSPEVIGAAIIGYSPVKNFNVELNGKYVGRQYLDNTQNESRSLDSYMINDLLINYSFSIKKVREISFSFSVNNIFAVEYISNGYTYSDYSGGKRNDYNFYFPQAKRTFFVGINFKF